MECNRGRWSEGEECWKRREKKSKDEDEEELTVFFTSAKSIFCQAAFQCLRLSYGPLLLSFFFFFSLFANFAFSSNLSTLLFSTLSSSSHLFIPFLPFLLFFIPFIYREQVIDDIEITILSRELPDRLLLFRNIVHDPQVSVAVKVLKESIISSDIFSNAVHDACVIPGTPDERIAECINDKITEGSAVRSKYEALLTATSTPVVDITADTK